MSLLRASLPALLLIVLACAPARAQDPVDRLAALLTEAARSANPSMAFLKGVAGLPDTDMDQAQVRAALTRAGIGSGNMLERLLGPTQRITKQGDRVKIKRGEKTVISLDPKGAIELDRDIEVRLRLQGADQARIDKVSGIKVGEAADSLYSLWDIDFKKENGRPVAKVTAGKLVFSKTVTIDLTPKTPPAAAPAPTTSTPTTSTPTTSTPTTSTPTTSTPTTTSTPATPTPTTPTVGITGALPTNATGEPTAPAPATSPPATTTPPATTPPVQGAPRAVPAGRLGD